MTALPPLLQDVARVAGLDAAIAIARRLGGRRMYVPHNPRPSHELVQAVGTVRARVIGGLMGGERVVWPKAQTYLNRLDARSLKARGWSPQRIAAKLGLTERYVRSITRGVERGDPGSDPELQQAIACPSCGRRYHRRGRCPGDDTRQMPLPGV